MDLDNHIGVTQRTNSCKSPGSKRVSGVYCVFWNPQLLASQGYMFDSFSDSNNCLWIFVLSFQPEVPHRSTPSSLPLTHTSGKVHLKNYSSLYTSLWITVLWMLFSSADYTEARFLPKRALLIWKFKTHPAERPHQSHATVPTGTDCSCDSVAFLVFSPFCFSSVDSCNWAAFSFLPFFWQKQRQMSHKSLCLYHGIKILKKKI